MKVILFIREYKNKINCRYNLYRERNYLHALGIFLFLEEEIILRTMYLTIAFLS